MNLLITGLPKSGRTTLLREIISTFECTTGFVTDDIRENGERTGFSVETSDGTSALLASIHRTEWPIVGKYRVDPEALSIVIPNLKQFSPNDILYIDEIGQMEFLADGFESFCRAYLDSPNTCIATLSQVYSNEFIEAIRKRKDVMIFEITDENREEIKKEIMDFVILSVTKWSRKIYRFSSLRARNERGNLR